MTAEDIYEKAVANLGNHLTLNPAVPAERGCAEAVSDLLKMAGVQGIPAKGYASTIDLCNWLSTNPIFQETHAPTFGGVVISPTNGNTIGHTGIILKHGIASNDSSTGRFQENYSLQGWYHTFTEIKGLPTRYFALYTPSTLPTKNSCKIQV